MNSVIDHRGLEVIFQSEHVALMAREGEILQIFGFAVGTVDSESFFPLDETVDVKIVRTCCDGIDLMLQTNGALFISDLALVLFCSKNFFPLQLILIDLNFPGIYLIK